MLCLQQQKENCNPIYAKRLKDNASANRDDSMPASKKLKLTRRVVHETIQQDGMLSTPNVIFVYSKMTNKIERYLFFLYHLISGY